MPLLWPVCWELVCTSPLSGQPPSLRPPPQPGPPATVSGVSTWSFPDEVASWAEDTRAPCLAPAVSRKIATGWPLQLLSSRLSPAACPQPPVPSFRSPPFQHTADAQVSPAQGPASCSLSLPRSALVHSNVLCPAEAWPFCLGSPRDTPNHAHRIPGQAVQPSQHRP